MITPPFFFDQTYYVTKLFSNGASEKLIRILPNQAPTEAITPYKNDKDDEAQYIKYIDLGQNQSNYNQQLNKAYNYCQAPFVSNTNPNYGASQPCDYLYGLQKKQLKIQIYMIIG